MNYLPRQERESNPPSPMSRCLSAIEAGIERELARRGGGDAGSADEIAAAVHARLRRVAPEAVGTSIDLAIRELVRIRRERGRDRLTLAAPAISAAAADRC